LRQAGDHFGGRQRFQDHAGRKRQDLRRFAAQLRGQRGAGFIGQRQAQFAGAGIGVAGVDQQRGIGLPLVLAAARWALAICTGAAQKRFSVNTPATVAVGASFITSTSLRFGFLMPASAKPISTPATGFSSEAMGRGN
jgi:hypothetical protein